jgi:hypothetical protein
MERRLLYIPVLHIDTNLINARQKLVAVNQLEKWFEDGVILMNMSGTAQREAQAGNNPRRTAKANQQIYTTTTPASPGDSRYREIEPILFPGGTQDENQRNDVRIVADAIHYAAVLVTADGGSKTQPNGILGNRAELAKLFAIRILSPDEAVAFVREKIRERDVFNERLARESGGKLPEWTGTD